MIVAIAGLVLLSQGQDQIPARIKSLVEAEKAFSTLCQKVGFRDSFIANFADEGLGFQPGPVKVKERLSARPPATTPSPVVFEWTPMEGDVSEGGDLGYTTGPVLYTDNSKTPPELSHGLYFSVWKRKDRQSEWKVVADIGVEVPSAVASQGIGFVDRSHFRAGSAYPKIESSEILDFDRNLSKKAKEKGVKKAYDEETADYARLHEDGKLPATGKQAVQNAAVNADGYPAFDPTESAVALSNDLAWTHGSYRLMKGDDKLGRGFYVHVWKRVFNQGWKLVVEVRKAAPTE